MDPDKQLELTVSEDTVTEELARRLEEESQRLDPDLVELFHEVLNGGKERVTLDETRGLLLYTPTFAEVLRNGLDWLREQSNNGPWQKLQRTRLGAARSKLEAHRTDVEVDSRVSAIQAALGLDEGEACYFLAASDYSYLAEYPLDGGVHLLRGPGGDRTRLRQGLVRRPVQEIPGELRAGHLRRRLGAELDPEGRPRHRQPAPRL